MKLTSLSTSQAFLVALTLTVCIGCNRGPSLYNIEGTVNVDGTPTEGINLLFYKQGQTSASASGVSKAGGALSAVTNGEPGIEAGDYQVVAIYPDPSVKTEPTAGMGKPPIDPPDLFKGKYFKDKISVKITGKEKVTLDLKLK